MRKLRNFKRRAVAVLMAIMCLTMIVPSGITALAAPADDDSYTVTLSDCDGGTVTFDDEEGDTAAFAEGDEVALSVTPDDGYAFSGITLTLTETGEVAAEDYDVEDTVGYTFTMPAADVTVKAAFEEAENLPDEVIDVDTDETDTDYLVESYIADNLDHSYVATADNMQLVNYLKVMNTLFDGTYVKKGDTIASIMDAMSYADEEAYSKFITSIDTKVALYSPSNDSDYLVAYANTMDDVKSVSVFDYVFALNDTYGNLVDGCYYDKSTGIAYIPKALYFDEDDNYYVGRIQIQLGQLVKGDYTDMDSEVDSSVLEEGGDEISVYSIAADIYDLETTAVAEPGLTKDDLNVFINGIPVDDDEYEYNAATGEVKVDESTAGISNISVEVDEDAYGITTYANGYPDDMYPSTWDEVKYAGAGEVQVPSWVTVGTAVWSSQAYMAYYLDGDEGGENWPMATEHGWGYSYQYDFDGDQIDWDNSDGETFIEWMRTTLGNANMEADNILQQVYGLDFMFNLSASSFSYTTQYQRYYNDSWHELINTTADGVDHTGDVIDFSALGTMYGQCCNISGETGSFSGNSDWNTLPMLIRFLKTGKESDGTEYALIGIVSAEMGSQCGYGLFKVRTVPSSGYLTLNKTSANTSITSANSCYSLANAVYGVYASTSDANSDSNRLATLTTDDSGNTNTVELDVGDYYVKEVTASKGYYLCDSEHPCSYSDGSGIHTVTVESSETSTVHCEEVPMNDPAGITIYKEDAESGEQVPQGDAGLEGAEFTICFYDGYYDENALPSSPTRTWVLKTKYYSSSNEYRADITDSDCIVTEKSDALYYDEYGKVALPLGTYTIQETSAPTGYLIEGSLTDQNGDKTVSAGSIYYTQYRDADEGTWLYGGNVYTGTDTPQRGGVKVQKRDVESLRDYPQGEGSFEGIKLTITNKSEESVLVEGEWYEPGEVVKTMYTDADGGAETSADCLPYGSYTLTEEDVPSDDGHLLGSEDHTNIECITSIDFEIREEGKIVDLTGEDVAINDLVKRGDIALKKHDEKTQESMSVPFQITSRTTGESHVFWTDENGDYSSDSTWNKHTDNTNAGETPMDGIWFYGYADEEASGVEVDNSLGALPYDTYNLDELPCEANEGKELVHTSFTIRRDTRVIDLGTYVNPDIEVPEPYIHSQAWAGDTGTQLSYAGNGEVTLYDDVYYYNLTPDTEYNVYAVALDSETHEAVTDANGDKIATLTTFTPEDAEGTLTQETTADVSDLAGERFVMYEVIYTTDEDGNNTIVAYEGEEDYESQTIYFPDVHTTLTEITSGTHVAIAGESITLTDKVSVTGVPKGNEMTVSGTLMLKSTGEALLDENGDPVSAAATYTSEGTDETFVDLSFTFDASALEGDAVVAFEDLYLVTDKDEEKGVLVGRHEDLEDEGQTVTFPEIHTEATYNGEKIVPLGVVTINDVVDYTNLEPGRTYKMVATEMVASTGETVIYNGEAVTSEVEFKPDEPDGQLEVELTFDTTDYAGEGLVTFEKCYVLGDDGTYYEVGNHEDLTDEGQTVTVEVPPEEVPPEETPPAETPTVKTGQMVGGIVAAIAALLAIMGIVITARRRRRI